MQTISLPRLAGLMLGLTVAAALVGVWRVPSNDAHLGADVRLTVTARGELELSPTGVVATGRALRAGGRSVDGRVTVRNITAVPLRLGVRAVPSTPDLDRKLAVRVTTAGGVLLDRRLGDGAVAAPLTLQPGEVKTLVLDARVPVGATDYQGRAADVALTFLVEAGG